MNYSDIGRQFGLNEEQTQAAFEALGPVIAAGMRRNASTGSMTEIIEAMQRGGGGASATDFGNVVLGEAFGSKDVSRGVAQQLSATSGIGAAVLKKLLPIIATIVMGQVAKKVTGGGGGGGIGDILGDILGGGSRPAPRQANPGGGGLGDILNDILGGGAGRQAQQAPSEQTGPKLEDILGDILGGGAGRAPRQQAPQQMPGGFEDILKDIFGGGMGGGAPSGGDQGMPQPRMQQRRSADAADDLLNSVEQAVRRR